MKIIFAGTTQFGIPTLEKLKKQFEIPLIITQPDQPAGRKKLLTPPPIKLWAQANNIKIEQPEKIFNLKSLILNLKPDLLLVAAYGQIVPKEILDIPKFGSVNIHASLLPQYRGATPIQNAILNGDKTTGITLIKMDEKMDHGPLLAQQTINIDNNDNYESLHDKLSEIAADLMNETLPKWFNGKIHPTEQNHAEATFTKIFTRTDGRIDWTSPAVEILRKIRALNPEPGTWTTLNSKSVKIIKANIVEDAAIELPGAIHETNKQMLVKCQDHNLKIIMLQEEGKRITTGADFINGLKNKANKNFT